MKFTQIPEYGDLMTLSDFVESCYSDFFTDYDGHGYYATDAAMSDMKVRPSDAARGVVDRSFTHVVWFNK